MRHVRALRTALLAVTGSVDAALLPLAAAAASDDTGPWFAGSTTPAEPDPRDVGATPN
jgi:hypothetical protein